MARAQGLNSVGEEMSSAYVIHDPEDYGFDTEGPSLTRQEFAEECDVNALMARYEKTGMQIPSHMSREPQYLDLSDVPDLHTAMNVMREAEAAFMQLPGHIRLEFSNDAVKFVEFAEDKDNLEQLREWGLAKPAEPTPAPQRVEVVNPSVGGEASPGAGQAPASS